MPAWTVHLEENKRNKNMHNQEGMIWDPIKRFNPAAFMCYPKPGPEWNSNVICLFYSFFYFQARGDCLFC